jgi:hypothetical protein
MKKNKGSERCRLEQAALPDLFGLGEQEIEGWKVAVLLYVTWLNPP